MDHPSENLDHLRRFNSSAKLSDLVLIASEHSERIIIEHAGRAVGLVPIEDVQWLERQDRLQDEQDLAEIQRLKETDPESMRGVPFEPTK
jgi:hypothetical protein